MIFIRPCGHSDDTGRKTKHPNRCWYCHYNARVARLEGLLRAKDTINALRAQSPESGV